MGLGEDIAKLIIDASSAIGKSLKEGVNEDFYIVHQPLHHEPKPLPNGKMAVYTFYYQKENLFLKIGQVNDRSNARYQSQHYHINSARSNLAKSLVNKPLPSIKGLVNESNVTQWIKDNCERFDVMTQKSMKTTNFS